MATAYHDALPWEPGLLCLLDKSKINIIITSCGLINRIRCEEILIGALTV